MSGAVPCGLCSGATTKPRHFSLLHPLTGRERVILCPQCVANLSWRALDPILVADDPVAPLPRIFAGKAAISIWRNIRVAQSTRAAAEVAPQAVTAPPAQTGGDGLI
jgi:hypothetical protein